MASFINLILDIAAVLLWLNWRSVRFDPFAARGRPATLAGTVRRAEPSRLKRWHFLAAIAVLLIVRAFFYRHIAPAAHWTPKLNLGLVMLAFSGSHFGSMLLFSVASFVRTLAVVYCWLLILAVINGRTLDPDPIQKLIQLQLGAVSRWPRLVQLLLPAAGAAALWMAFHPLLLATGVVHRASSLWLVLRQGLAIGGATYFTLKHPLPVILLLHLIASYIYLGPNPLWEFISTTARKLLRPLDRLPLRLGRVDLKPVAGIVLILLLLHAIPMFLMRYLDARQLTLWPQ